MKKLIFIITILFLVFTPIESLFAEEVVKSNDDTTIQTTPIAENQITDLHVENIMTDTAAISVSYIEGTNGIDTANSAILLDFEDDGVCETKLDAVFTSPGVGNETTVTFDIDYQLEPQFTYNYKVELYDNAGNMIEAEESFETHQFVHGEYYNVTDTSATVSSYLRLGGYTNEDNVYVTDSIDNAYFEVSSDDGVTWMNVGGTIIYDPLTGVTCVTIEIPYGTLEPETKYMVRVNITTNSGANLVDGSHFITLASVDSDNDGLTDSREIELLGTDPTNPDTDGDCLEDGEEVNNGTDPLNSDGSTTCELTIPIEPTGSDNSPEQDGSIENSDSEIPETETLEETGSESFIILLAFAVVALVSGLYFRYKRV